MDDIFVCEVHFLNNLTTSLRTLYWVLETYRYKDLDELLNLLPEKVIAPAEAKVKELTEKKKP